VGVKLFRADGWTDRQTERQTDRTTDMELILAFRNFENAPKNTQHKQR